MSILKEAEQLFPSLLAWQQELHSHPEASGQERFATALIRRECAAAGWDLLETGLDSGLVACLPGGSGCPVALRCDIDAVAAEGGPDHRCGHDYHTAALLGAAKLLSAHRQELPGPVWLLFQPAEETLSGSQALLEQGLSRLLPPETRIFGIHNRPELPWGVVGVKAGPLMAAKRDFIVTFQGRSGHGGMPQLCVDPLVAAAAFVQGVQTVISRNSDPLQPSVCAVCSIHGGSEDNFAPESVRLTGSIRTLEPDFVPTASCRLQELTSHIAAAYQCAGTCCFRLDIPVLDNSPALLPWATAAAAAVVGGENLTAPQPVLACEDFAVYGRIWPAFFYWVGSGPAHGPITPWHSPNFSIEPQTLVTAAALYAQTALEQR